MAISEDRFNKLVQRVKNLEDDSTGVTNAKSDTPAPRIDTQKAPSPIIAWIPGIAVLVALLGIGVTVALHLNTRIDSTKADFAGLSGKVDKLDAAVKTLSSQQTDQTQKLIHDLLAAAQTSDPSIAAKATLVAASLTVILRQEKHPAPSEFFIASLDTLNAIKPKAENEVLAAKLSLADYHSAIYDPSNLAVIFAPGSSEGLSIKDLENLPTDRDSTIKGFRVWITQNAFREGPGPHVVNMSGFGGIPAIILNLSGGDFLYPNRTTPEFPRVSSFVIVTPSQTLDDAIWQNVVFVNARIRYHGGPVTLNNVRFINCTFESQADKRPKQVQKFLDYAALQSESSLSIGL